MRIAFNNAENGYQADEVTLYLDGYDATNATKFETLAVAGKTDPDEVRTVGRQFINNSLRQTESFTFDMDAEALTCRPGAYAVLLHDAIGVGLGAARVKSLETSGSNVNAFTLDFGVATEASDTLAARWRKPDGDGGFEVASEAGVTRDAANPARFVFGTPRPVATAPAVEEVVLIGRSTEVSLPVLVRDIAPDFGHRASITVIPYAGERFTPDGTPLPPHDPMVQLPIAARPVAPIAITTTANAREIALSFFEGPPPRGVTLTGFETAVREHGDTSDSWQDRGPLPADARVFVAPPGNPGYSYDLRVVAVGNDSGGLPVRSDPLIVEDIDAATVPVAPTGCNASFTTRTSPAGAQQLVLSCDWDPVEDPDVIDTVVELLTSTGPDVWSALQSGLAVSGAMEIHGLQVGRDYQLGFRHLSRRGIASARTTVPLITAADVLVAASATIANSIVGQGWGATASEGQASNAMVPVACFNRNPTFQDWTSTLPATWSSNGSPTVSKNTTDRIYGAHSLDVTAGATDNVWLLTTSNAELRIPHATTYVTFEWEVQLVSGDFRRAGILHRHHMPDGSNVRDWRVSLETEHGASPAAGHYKGAKTLAFGVTTGTPTGLPTGSQLGLMMNWNGVAGSAASAKRIRWHRVSVRAATAQEIAAALALEITGKLSALAGIFGEDIKESLGGAVATLANFKTLLGTSAAFVGQAALATLNFTTLGTNVRLADGVTLASNALLVTSLGTAAGITGQGWGATASEAQASNAQVAAGDNGLVDTGFRFQSTYWAKDSQSGSTTFSAPVSTGGLRKSAVTGAGLTVGHYVRQISTAQQTHFQCKPGDVVGARVLAGGDNLSQLQLLIAFRDAAGVAVGFSTTTTVSSGILDGSGEETTFNEMTAVATAPSGTVFATIDVRGIASAAAPVLRIAKPLIARLPAGQTVVPVYHPGREHELGANVTETRVAAAILSQGWGATASQAQASNALVQAGANGLVDTAFRFQSTYWTKDSVSGSTTFSVATSTGGLRKSLVTGAGVTVNGTDYVRQRSDAQKESFPCKAGDVVGARVLLGGDNVSQLSVRISFRNSAGALLSSSTATTLSSGLLTGSGEKSDFNELTATGTAPANTATAVIDVRGIASSAAPVLRMAEPVLAILPTGQTVVPPFTPGREHELGANVTETRTAAGITSQGSLATLNFVTIGTNLRRADGTTVASESLIVTSLGTASSVTGQGALATQNFVLFSSTVRLADGTTVVTDAMVVTASGTAAGIAGQGNFATNNFYVQTTEPGSPQNGWWWADTTANLLKVRVSGAWVTVADITPAGGISDDLKTFTKEQVLSAVTTSGADQLVAIIDVTNVGAGGFLGMPGTYVLGSVGGNLSSGVGSFWYGELVLTEQPLAGGTEVDAIVIPLTIENAGSGLLIVDAAAPSMVAQTYSGSVRYRLRLRRTSGSNTIINNGVYGKAFVQRVPG